MWQGSQALRNTEATLVGIVLEDDPARIIAYQPGWYRVWSKRCRFERIYYALRMGRALALAYMDYGDPLGPNQFSADFLGAGKKTLDRIRRKP